MDIVIHISKSIFDMTKEMGCIIDADNKVVANAIIDGTLLPKGHGRLIDADFLADRLEKLRDVWNYYGNEYENGMYRGFDCSLDEVIDAPTIIESDMEEESDTP